MVNERALSNRSASSSSAFCAGVKTRLVECDNDVGNHCDKVCASVAGGLCGIAPDHVEVEETIIVTGVGTGG